MNKITSKECRQVRQSELGLFINKIDDGTYLDTRTLTDLADAISEEFDVLCTGKDLEVFYNLENFDEELEQAHRRIEYDVNNPNEMI